MEELRKYFLVANVLFCILTADFNYYSSRKIKYHGPFQKIVY